MKSRLVPGVLIGGLVLAGGGSVIAASGGSSSESSSAKQQYCPPNSPGAGQPQGGPGNNCGNPPDKCPNGQPKPPGGNCGKKPGSQGEKRAKFKVNRKPARRCYSRRFTLNVKVSNRGKGRKTSVYRDGRRIKKTGRSKFTVNVKVGHLKRGVHKLRLKVVGADGKTRTRTVKFRRC
jgi:hypothetical protein